MHNSTKIIIGLTWVSIFLIPFYFFRFSAFGIPSNIFEIFVIISFLSTICYLLSTKTKIKFPSIWLGLFLLAALIAVIIADDTIKALGIFKSWFLIPALFYFTFISVGTDYKKIFWSLYAALQLVSIWAILQKLGLLTTLFYQTGNPDFDQYLSGNMRAFGPFDSPNSLAMFLAPMFLLTVGAMLSIKLPAKFALWSTLLLPLLALWFSGSRGGIIALVVAVMAIILIAWRKKLLNLKLFLTLFLLIILLGFFAIKSLETGSDRTGSNQSRMEIYRYSIQIGKSYPFFGVGLGGFEKAIREASSSAPIFQKESLSYAFHPHNLYLAIWLNLGVIGLVAFALMIYQFMIGFFIKRQFGVAKIFIAGAIIAILVHGLFDTTYFKNDLSVIFWLCLALGFLNGKKDVVQNCN